MLTLKMKKKKKTSINDGDISLKKSEKGQVNQNEEKEIITNMDKTLTWFIEAL